jgi:hypothetical protein
VIAKCALRKRGEGAKKVVYTKLHAFMLNGSSDFHNVTEIQREGMLRFHLSKILKNHHTYIGDAALNRTNTVSPSPRGGKCMTSMPRFILIDQLTQNV